MTTHHNLRLIVCQSVNGQTSPNKIMDDLWLLVFCRGCPYPSPPGLRFCPHCWNTILGPTCWVRNKNEKYFLVQKKAPQMIFNFVLDPFPLRAGYVVLSSPFYPQKNTEEGKTKKAAGPRSSNGFHGALGIWINFFPIIVPYSTHYSSLAVYGEKRFCLKWWNWAVFLRLERNLGCLFYSLLQIWIIYPQKT